MVARIFKPSKSAMQSGRGKSKEWVLKFDHDGSRSRDPLMGYTSSSDMTSQVRLTFDSLDEAEAYANDKGLAYVVEKPQERRIKRVSYAENFKFGRQMPWTH